ncbi:signal peptidase I [Curtobacterium sp. Leaf261]|uniref:signal peptidase I n=1 Tax=Curtobacterium sp. Leaf261 TaxID=1736311 RepID=UPI000701BDE0|nr:signal peptidase I [Curtobacterium sp. Leaf261]KQO62265.1 hypothetical protein ASF23_10670 [Curtobacterium sp. Leaf261]
MIGSSAAVAPTPPGDTGRPSLPRGVVVARTLREVVLWVAAAIGVLCLLVAAAAVLLHVTPLVFRSGSMGPGIPTGSVGLAQPIPPTMVRVGQIVSVVLPDGTRVTHRVHDVVMQGDAARITLKGDANAHPDPVPVVTTSVDRVFWSTPGLGYLLEGAARPAVVFVGGALIGMIAMWGFRRPTPLPGEIDDQAPSDDESGPVDGMPTDTGREARGRVPASARVAHAGGPRHAVADARRPRRHPVERGEHGGGHVAALIAGGVVVALGATIAVGADPAAAAPWTDQVTATSPTLQAGSMLPPVSFTCSATNGITLTWQPPATGSVPVQSYRIDVANAGLGANLPSSGALPSTATSYNYSSAAISLLTVGNTYTFTLSASNGNWTASTTRSATVLLSIVRCN